MSRDPHAVLTARELGVLRCTVCALVCRAPEQGLEVECPRCGQALHARKPDSLVRTWAFLATAILLYIPANALPIMHTKTLFDDREDTIISGVLALWAKGSWDLALIVFVASIVVPLAKIAVLIVLLLSVQFGWVTGRRRRTRLFRLVEWVGQWSMLDIFVVVLMVALVQFSTLARIDPGPGAAAFGAVVVMTIFAAQSFDARLIWDAAEGSLHDD